jgi:hypothetical protein
MKNQITTPTDASRRRFLGVAAAASVVSVSALAAAAMPVPVSQCDAEIVAAGIQFEALLTQWMPAWFEWARLHCEAKDEAIAKFGEDEIDNPAWNEPQIGTSPGFIFQMELTARNGCDIAAAHEAALFDPMVPLANRIRESEVTSLAGLRAKTLVSVLDFWPSFSGLVDNSHYSLFSTAVAVTGLSDLVGDIDKRLKADAGLTLRDGAPLSDGALVTA